MVAVIVIAILLLVFALRPGASGGSGQVGFSGIDVQWNGGTYPLLDNPYSSSTADHGYGSAGFTFSAEFSDSGSCPGDSTSCFNPGTNFSLTSATKGFTVSWVTACYQSRGYSALVGPIFYRYSASPGNPISGCASSGDDVEMAGVTAGTLVYLTVAVQFTTSSYSGNLVLKATDTNQNVTVTTGDPTVLQLLCTPGAVVLQAVTPCTATVSDTGPAPTVPTGVVNFTADSGQFGPSLPSCTLAASPSAPSSAASCSVNYVPANLGGTDILASYSGDKSHVGSSAGFQVGAFEYSLALVPASESVAPGGSVTFTVNATLVAGSSTLGLPNVTLSVQSCTPGVMSCSFLQATVAPTTSGSTTILTISVPGQPAVQLPASFSLTVVGTTGSGDLVSMVDSNDVTLTIT
jgi:hypothetical protein